jgi:hypothetical protein
MDEASPNPAVLKGSMFYKLIQRALPGWFEYNSIYLWQPMYIPGKNIELAKDQRKIKEFNTSEPQNPKVPAEDIKKCEQIMEVQKNLKTFKNPAFLELKRLEDGPVLDFLKEINNQAEDVEEYSFEKLGGREPELFEYFAELAKNMLHNERLEWIPDKDKGEKYTWQIDIIRECAIPISFIPY